MSKKLHNRLNDWAVWVGFFVFWFGFMNQFFFWLGGVLFCSPSIIRIVRIFAGYKERITYKQKLNAFGSLENKESLEKLLKTTSLQYDEPKVVLARKEIMDGKELWWGIIRYWISIPSGRGNLPVPKEAGLVFVKNENADSMIAYIHERKSGRPEEKWIQTMGIEGILLVERESEEDIEFLAHRGISDNRLEKLNQDSILRLISSPLEVEIGTDYQMVLDFFDNPPSVIRSERLDEMRRLCALLFSFSK